MDNHLMDQLGEDFSFMKRDNGNSVYCACGNGWYELIWNLCHELASLYEDNNVDLDNIEVLQVKEKFGQLRFYVGWMIDGSYKIIEKYEKLSESTCEICGDKGELRGDYAQTLCDSHYMSEVY